MHFLSISIPIERVYTITFIPVETPRRWIDKRKTYLVVSCLCKLCLIEVRVRGSNDLIIVNSHRNPKRIKWSLLRSFR